MVISKKIIVSNQGALKNKKRYGDGFDLIEGAINTMIGSDQRRGIQTSTIYMDVPADMNPYDAPVVNDATDERQNKEAIDALYKAITPDYLMILGAPDIVPHQTLNNPMGYDGDRNVPSDIPYACDAAYSTNPSDFIGPTRIVGRIPGINGSNDVNTIIKPIDAASAVQPKPRDAYMDYLAVSAEVWKGSSTQSTTHIFGNTNKLHFSPPDGPNWTPQQIGVLSQFVNCHGGDSDPKWYGQGSSGYPIAFEASQVDGKIIPNTAIAVECCYGAQLYRGGSTSLCNTYLMNDAIAFCGSTNIAYGPASGQGQADLMTQYFLINLFAGASVGRAMLEARQQFAGKSSSLSPADLKTMVQFILLGDPSAQPVEIDLPVDEGTIALLGKENLLSGDRKSKRQSLWAAGKSLLENVGYSVEDKTISIPESIQKNVDSILSTIGMTDVKQASYRVTGGTGFLAAKNRMNGDEIYHLFYGKIGPGTDTIPSDAVLIVKELNGEVVTAQVIHRK